MKLLIALFVSLLIFVFCSKDFNPASPEMDKWEVVDIDGNVYKTVRIGRQWWIAENLRVTHFCNGESIPNVTNSSQWTQLLTSAYCTYNDSLNNVKTHGHLYNWYAVKDNRNIAPKGWHVPTDKEWKELEMHLGMTRFLADQIDWRGTDEGGKLKKTGIEHWQSPNTGATNESGFTALPSGCRSCEGRYYDIGYNARFWSSTKSTEFYDEWHAWSRTLAWNSSDIARYPQPRQCGYSVRCVKD
jgi:uncharacterized protein (TIGR02145 family)